MSDKEEMLTADDMRQLFSYDPDTGTFTWKVRRQGIRPGKAGALWGPKDKPYIYIGINYEKYLAHRLAWLYVHGEWPNGFLDHINGDTLDNRIANLRLASPSDNSQNRRKTSRNTSGFKGVCYLKSEKKWRAMVIKLGKQHYCGTYDTPSEAWEAYKRNAALIAGEFARFE